MASYGDILEIDGQLVELTPVGYMPVSTGGMLSDPFDPNAGTTTSSFGNFEEPRTYFPQPNNDRPIITDPQFIEFIERTLREEEYQRFIRDNFLRSDETEEDPRGPAPEVNIDEDVFQMILDSILGRANDIPPEILLDETNRNVFISSELSQVAQEIEEAGGWEEWLAQQPTGDPGDLDPPPAPEPEPEPAPEMEQVLLNEGEFNEQFPDVDPSEYTESGTWTDPETGIVYVINIPPTTVEPTEEEESGGGGAEAPTDAEGEPTTDQPAEEEVIVDPTDSTVDDEDAETATTVPADSTVKEDLEEEEVTPSPFFRVENGQVYVLDYETGEFVPVDPAIYEGYLGRNPEDGVYTDQGVRIEDENIILGLPDFPVVFDPSRTPDFPGGPAPIPEQEPVEPTTPTEPTEPTTPTEPVPPAEEVPETPTEPTPPAEEPEQPTEETEPTPPTEQPTEQPTPTEEAPETPEQPGTETPSDTPTTGTDDTGTEGEGDAPTTGTGTQPGSGDEGDGTGTGKKRDGLFDDYQEFMTSIGYQPVQLQQLIAPPKKDYFRELDSLIGRSLFGKMIG